MSAHLCIVSGTLVAPDGSPMPDVNVHFLPAPVAMRAVDSRILAPRPVTVTADAEARISVQLAPGVYSVRTREAAGREYDPYLIEVPARETAELSEIVIPLQAPQSVYDAAASARQAALSAGEVQAVLDQIQGLEGTDLAALAQLVEEVQGFIPETGADGEVLTLTGGAPAWRPAPGGAVASVNGQTGAVVLSATGLGAATAAQGARADSALQPGAPIPWADVTGTPALFPPAPHGHAIPEIAGLAAALDAKAGRTTFSAGAAGLVPASGAGSADRFLRADGAWVEPPGSGGGGTIGWADVTGKPGWTASFDGSYASLAGTPVLGSAAAAAAGDFATAVQGARADTALQPGAQIPWADITGAPALATVAVSGRYDDLANRPALFDGTWDSLAGRPASFPPAGHGHGMAEIDGLQAALDTKADAAAIGDIQAILESI